MGLTCPVWVIWSYIHDSLLSPCLISLFLPEGCWLRSQVRLDQAGGQVSAVWG